MRINKKVVSSLSFFVMILICLFVVLTGCAKQEIKNTDSKGKTVVCFGDSITFGYGAEPGEEYPALLRKMIDAPVINTGIDGDTSVEGLKRIDSDVLDRNPLLVIIEFGGNDFLRKIPIGMTLANITEMIDKVQAAGSMAAIADISAGMFLREYYIAFSRLAREKGAIFIPSILSGIITNPRMKSDFFHPNGYGYSMITKKIYKAISPYVNKK